MVYVRTCFRFLRIMGNTRIKRSCSYFSICTKQSELEVHYIKLKATKVRRWQTLKFIKLREESIEMIENTRKQLHLKMMSYLNLIFFRLFQRRLKWSRNYQIVKTIKNSPSFEVLLKCTALSLKFINFIKYFRNTFIHSFSHDLFIILTNSS